MLVAPSICRGCSLIGAAPLSLTQLSRFGDRRKLPYRFVTSLASGRYRYRAFTRFVSVILKPTAVVQAHRGIYDGGLPFELALYANCLQIQPINSPHAGGFIMPKSTIHVHVFRPNKAILYDTRQQRSIIRGETQQ